MTYHLLYFIFILDWEIMLDKSQIQASFLFKFKMGHTTRDTLHQQQHGGLELLTNVQCSGGSESFAKETRALKRSILAGDWKLIMTNLEHHRS